MQSLACFNAFESNVLYLCSESRSNPVWYVDNAFYCMSSTEIFMFITNHCQNFPKYQVNTEMFNYTLHLHLYFYTYCHSFLSFFTIMTLNLWTTKYLTFYFRRKNAENIEKYPWVLLICFTSTKKTYCHQASKENIFHFFNPDL